MVAVRPNDAERLLAAPPEGVRLFLIYGGDPGGVTERARLVERVALKRGGGDAVLRIGSDELTGDPGRLVDEANSASLFGGEPVVALRVLDGRHNVIGALQPLLDRPPTAGWVIVEAAELAPTSPLRKGFEASRAALAVPTFHLEGAGLASFIRAAAEAEGVRVAPDALELLVGALGGDRLAARRELEKLFLYVGPGGTAAADDVATIVTGVLEVRADQLIDAALAGDSEALEAGLERLRGEGGSAAGIAAQALRHLLLLQGLRAQMDEGASATAVLAQARPPIFVRRRDHVEAQLKRWRAGDLAEHRRRLADAIALSRRQSTLETAAISQALHEIALQAGLPHRSRHAPR